MARAMSASLASARMKSLQPCGSAWMRRSLRSRDFSFMTSLIRTLSANSSVQKVDTEGRDADNSDQHALADDHSCRAPEHQAPDRNGKQCQHNLRSPADLTGKPAKDQDHHIEDG